MNTNINQGGQAFDPTAQGTKGCPSVAPFIFGSAVGWNAVVCQHTCVHRSHN